MRIKPLNPAPSLGLLFLRLMVCVVMMYHANLKMQNYGLGGVEKMVGGLGFPGPAVMWALMLLGAETVGAAMLAVGFLTRLAAFSLAVDMAVAVAKVHGPNGFSNYTDPQHVGYEFALTLGVIAFALMFTGPGAISLDHWLFYSRKNRSGDPTAPVTTHVTQTTYTTNDPSTPVVIAPVSPAATQAGGGNV